MWINEIPKKTGIYWVRGPWHEVSAFETQLPHFYEIVHIDTSNGWITQQGSSMPFPASIEDEFWDQPIEPPTE